MKRWLLAATCGCLQTLAIAEQTIPISLQDCIEQALARNLDIAVERLNPRIQQATILAEKGAFDVHLKLTATQSEVESPLFVVQTNSAATETRNTILSPRLQGKLPWGATYELSYDSTLQETSPRFIDQHRSLWTVSLTQPLLRNFGLSANLASLRIARKNRQISHYALRQKLADTINAVHRAYFDLVYAMDNLTVQEESLALARALLEENKKRYAVGLMSPLDVTQAESGVAAQEVGVIEAQQAIRTQSLNLYRLISSDLAAGRQPRLVPVDVPTVQPLVVQVEESIARGIRNRPEYLQQKEAVEASRIQLRYQRNQLWPQVDLSGRYGQAGLANYREEAVDQAFTTAEYPQWFVGLTVDIPLGDLTARGNYRAARLRFEQALLQLKNVEQEIIREIHNAAAQVQTNLKRIEATRAARRLAEETWNAERKKLEAGTTTSYTVLQHQRDARNARSQELRAIADYNLSLAELFRAEGTLLEKYQVVVADSD